MPNPVAGTEAPLSWTLEDQTGAALNLTGATVTLIVTSPAGADTTYAATVTNAASGIATCTLDATAIAKSGAYGLRWSVVFADGSPGKTDPIAYIAIS